VWNGSEAEGTLYATNSTRGATRGFVLGRQPGGTLLGEADCTGLDPDGVYVYAERVEGRARRPPQRASTVARNKAAHWKANQHETTTAYAQCAVMSAAAWSVQADLI